MKETEIKPIKETPTRITYRVETFPFQRGHVLTYPDGREVRIIDVQKNSDDTVTLTAMSKSTLWQRLKIRVANRINRFRQRIIWQFTSRNKLGNFIKKTSSQQ